MIVVGIDVGSVATKAVILQDDKMFCQIGPTGWSPREAGFKILHELLSECDCTEDQLDYIVGTGYGRISLPFVKKTVTEITCHARGASKLVPGSTMVIDIGGQDSKVIKIDSRGQVMDFVMNDKCAAGTGRFLQVIAAALGSDVEELSALSLGKSPAPLNSMCAVFAESEVIGLLASGCDKGEIVAGLHRSIARRVANMAFRLGAGETATFTGGVANNEGLRRSLEAELGVKIIVPQWCQFAGALGAALIARETCWK